MKDHNYNNRTQRMSKGDESWIEMVMGAAAIGALVVLTFILALVWGA